jgi:hypothetical protein
VAYVEPSEADRAAQAHLHRTVGEAVAAAQAAVEPVPGVIVARPVLVTADGSAAPVVRRG